MSPAWIPDLGTVLSALSGPPLVRPGDDIAEWLHQALRRQRLSLGAGDVLVVAQKIVSIAEGRLVALASVRPSRYARLLAVETDKDPRLVELVLRESRTVLRHAPGVLIVEHRLGFVHANAGIDHSNVPQPENEPTVLLLPENPDRSASALREALTRRGHPACGIIINDSAGRAWRNGVVGIAIGCAGMQALDDRTGSHDLYGRPLQITAVGLADELSSAASWLMGQGGEGVPAVLIPAAVAQGHAGVAPLLRARGQDLFR